MTKTDLNMKRIYQIITIAAAAWALAACTDTASIESELAGLEDRTAELEKEAAKINSNAISIRKLLDETLKVVSWEEREDGTGYDLGISDGTTVSIYVSEDGGGIVPVIGIDAEGNWTVSLDGKDFSVIEGSVNAFITESAIPEVRVGKDGYWEISINGGKDFIQITDSDGRPVPAQMTGATDSFFTDVSYDQAAGKLDIILADGRELDIPVLDILDMEIGGYTEDGTVICLGEELHFPVTFSDDVAEAFCSCPDGWRVQIAETEDGTGQELIITGPASGSAGEYTVKIYLQSDEKYLRVYDITVTLNPVPYDSAACDEWNGFLAGDPDNIILDFSYAGYMHGETAPAEITMDLSSGTADVSGSTYRIYDITDYGAVPDDGKSDRDAFLSLLTEIAGEPVLNAAGDQLTFPHKNQYNAVIYFPEGDFILHTEEDNANDRTQSIIIRGGNLVIKGAGRDRTTVTMADPALPSSSAMYSSPDMIQLKHNTGVQYANVLATVTGDSEKGSFTVTVDGTGSLKDGDWVCLYLAPNNAPEVIAEELSPYQGDGSWAIVQNGVTVEDLHQVKSVSGNSVTFHEPLMHEVKAGWNWKIVRYQHYENVGVEDITFAGNAKENFDHHASWEDDGAYKPISMTRVVNSWMRRVGFHSVSEACSIITSANVSVYDIEIDGNRGHSAIRSQGSSRVFIGAVRDHSSGNIMDDLGHSVTGTWRDDAGQYHATGVSKLSIGAVLWRNVWGCDSCFESHATQPRATLIDCCSGGWRRWRQGGDANQMPNHLADLTVWNFNNTTPYSGTWIWWDSGSDWWKFLPPIIVGFHGENVEFDPEQTMHIGSNGIPVNPESLYEAQLRNRLGYIPAWLNALK